MSDPTELAGVGVGGLTIGGLLMGLLRASSTRNIATLDDTLKSLRSAVEVLSKDVRDLREANIGLAKDIGSISRRVEEQEREIVAVRRQMHRWGNFLQRVALRTATGEHVKLELPEDEDA